MRVSAKADYAVRASVELAMAAGATVKGERLASAQDIPLKFLENIMLELRHAGLVTSQRGPDGGYRLARAPETINVAEVMRAVEGPLAAVRGQRPEDASYAGSAVPLQRVWIALRASLRTVLEDVTLADLVSGELPEAVERLAGGEDAWVTR